MPVGKNYIVLILASHNHVTISYSSRSNFVCKQNSVIILCICVVRVQLSMFAVITGVPRRTFGMINEQPNLGTFKQEGLRP